MSAKHRNNRRIQRFAPAASVPAIVARELDRNPFLLEFLQRRLVNITALAAEIRETVERESGRKILLPTVSMAIRRSITSGASGASGSKRALINWRFPPNIPISAQSQVYEIAIAQSRGAQAAVTKIRKELPSGRGNFLSVMEGVYEVVIYVNQERKDEVRRLIRGQRITSELDNAAFITVNWARVTKDIPGIYFRITRALALRGISIQSFHTIGAEMMILVKDDVLVSAHQTIAELLQS